MSALTPKQIVDRNGVLTTRNVRAENPLPGAVPAMPAPVLHSPGAGAKLAEAVLRRLEPDLFVKEGVDPAVIRKELGSLPEDTAALLLETQSEANAAAFSYIIAGAVRNGDDIDMLENIAHVYTDYQYEGMLNHAYGVITADIRGLGTYPQLAGVTNYHRADENTRAVAYALTFILYEAEINGATRPVQDDDGQTATVLTDPRFVQMVIDHARDEDDEFLQMVNAHGCDFDLLTRLMETTRPLRGGML